MTYTHLFWVHILSHVLSHIMYYCVFLFTIIFDKQSFLNFEYLNIVCICMGVNSGISATTRTIIIFQNILAQGEALHLEVTSPDSWLYYTWPNPIIICVFLENRMIKLIHNALNHNTDQQFVFKTKHSSDICIFTVKTSTRISLDIKYSTPFHTCFLDANKSFNQVTIVRYLQA